MKNNFLRTCSLLLLICLLSQVLLGCSLVSPEPLTMTGIYFDTIVSIQAWGTGEETMKQCEQMCRHYEQLFSASIETSDVARINHSNGAPVIVSEETSRLIQIACSYSQRSDGAFDPTSATAGNLWNFKNNEAKELPDPALLTQAASHINAQSIQVNGCSVTLTDPQARIDLGGIAKGYIADQLKEYLLSRNVRHALINLGGNMLAVGGRPDGSSFRIGIQKPFAEQGETVAILPVFDGSVVSSGNYERYFEKNGVIYHHIIDTKTGWPVQNDLNQVTVLSQNSTEGDALSTACYALGLEKGMELIRSLDGVEAIFLTKEGELICSDQSLLPKSQ